MISFKEIGQLHKGKKKNPLKYAQKKRRAFFIVYEIGRSAAVAYFISNTKSTFYLLFTYQLISLLYRYWKEKTKKKLNGTL